MKTAAEVTLAIALITTVTTARALYVGAKHIITTTREIKS